MFVEPGLCVSVCWQFEECRVETLSGSCTDRQRAPLLTARAARLGAALVRGGAEGSDSSLPCRSDSESCCKAALSLGFDIRGVENEKFRAAEKLSCARV